jgi:hypothetical protein
MMTLQQHSDTRTEGLRLAKMTGEVSADNPHIIEITFPGGGIDFAKPCYGLAISKVTKEWISAHKDSMFVWIAYEAGENPVYVGFMPFDTELQPDYLHEWYSEKFFVGMDDKLGIKLSHDDLIVVEAKEVKVGESATEPMLLGDSTLSLISDLIDLVASLTVTTPWGVSGVPVTSAQITALKSRLNSLKSLKGKVE